MRCPSGWAYELLLSCNCAVLASCTAPWLEDVTLFYLPSPPCAYPAPFHPCLLTGNLRHFSSLSSPDSILFRFPFSWKPMPCSTLSPRPAFNLSHPTQVYRVENYLVTSSGYPVHDAVQTVFLCYNPTHWLQIVLFSHHSLGTACSPPCLHTHIEGQKCTAKVGHVLKVEECKPVKVKWRSQMEGKRSRGRQKFIWMDEVLRDTRKLGPNGRDAEDRSYW